MSELFRVSNRRYIPPMIFFVAAVALVTLTPQAKAALFNFNWESGGLPDAAVGLHGGYHVSVSSNAVLLAKSPVPKQAPRPEKQAVTTDSEVPPDGFLTIRSKTFRLPSQSAP